MLTSTQKGGIYHGKPGFLQNTLRHVCIWSREYTPQTSGYSGDNSSPPPFRGGNRDDIRRAFEVLEENAEAWHGLAWKGLVHGYNRWLGRGIPAVGRICSQILRKCFMGAGGREGRGRHVDYNLGWEGCNLAVAVVTSVVTWL